MSNLLSVGKIIDATWDHYVKHVKNLIAVTIWLSVVSFLSIIWIIVGPTTPEPTTSQAFQQILGGVVIGIVGMIVGFWIFLTLLQVTKATVSTKQLKKAEIKQFGKQSWQYIWPYTVVVGFKFLITVAPMLLIVPGVGLLFYNTLGPSIPWLSALGILLTFISVVAAFILVIYISTMLQYAEYVMLFENARGLNALKASRNLVEGRFWATLWRIIIPKIVFIIPVLFIQFVVGIFIGLLIPSFSSGNIETLFKISQIGDNLLSVCIAILSTPLFIIADYYVYDTLKKTAK